MHEIREILQRYPPQCHSSRIERLGSAGGLSGAQFWRTTTPGGVFVLRRWPVEHPTPQRLQFIHAVLAHAWRRGVMVLPLPIHSISGESFIHYAGHLWEFTPWLPGAADYDRSRTVNKLRAALTALAQFHIAVSDFAAATNTPAIQTVSGAPTAISRHIARLHALIHDGIDDLSRAITSATWPEFAPLAREFVSALPNVVPRTIAELEPLANVPLPLQPCIRDIWHDHVLFTGDEVTGLIDFGALDIDTPATDIARLLGSLAGDDAVGRQTGLAAYSAMRPLSQQESLAVEALDRSGVVLAGCNWIRWIYVEGRQFNLNNVMKRFRKIVARMVVVNAPRIPQ